MMIFDKLQKIILFVLVILVLAAVGWRINTERRTIPVELTEARQDVKMFKVTVTGEVQKPGTYTVRKGSRICDVIYAAGGITSKADVDIIDLDALVIDNTEIKVPGIDDAEYIPPIPCVNINTASTDELMLIPGIGEKTAQRIVNYRKSYGEYDNITEIMNVDGIGEKKFEEIKRYIITRETE